MNVSKDHKFLVVVPPSVGHMPVPGVDERVTARVFYVAPPRANQQLVIGAGGDKGLGNRLNYT